MITGLSHITLIVRDLNKSQAFLEAALDARRVYASGEKRFSLSAERFFLIGGLWVCIMEGEPPRERSYRHVAFQIPEEEFEDYEKKVRGAGGELRRPRPRVPGEGRSLYFYDRDGNLFELHTGTLENRLRAYEREAAADWDA